MHPTLIKFLYLLGRDALPLGEVEKLLQQAQAGEGQEIVYSNGGLAMWAEEVAEQLAPVSDNEESYPDVQV